MLIHLNKKTYPAFHHSNLEAVIVSVIGDPVMDLGWPLRLLAFLLGILVIRAAGAAGAGILSNEIDDNCHKFGIK